MCRSARNMRRYKKYKEQFILLQRESYRETNKRDENEARVNYFP